MKIKTVLFLVPALTIGGQEKQILGVIRGCKQAGYKVIVAYYGYAHPDNLEELENDDVFINKMPHSKIKQLFKIRNLIAEHQVETIVSYSYIMNIVSILSSKLSLRKVKVKVIVSERNYLPNSLSEKSVFYKFFVYTLIYIMYRFADVVVLNSTENKLYMDRQFGINNSLVINNFVNIIDLNNDAIVNPFNSDRYNIVFIGRLEYQKGVDILIKAVQGIHKDNILLHIIGSGSQEGSLIKLANNPTYQKECLFYGEVHKPYAYMFFADLIVIPSRYEGYPNVLLEAIQLNDNVITSDAKTGFSELTDNGNEVCNFSSESVKDLENRISCFALLNNPQKITHSWREEILEKHSFSAFLKKYLNII
jgi:glycosyltransferase involved in cell wall biosynthesis